MRALARRIRKPFWSCGFYGIWAAFCSHLLFTYTLSALLLGNAIKGIGGNIVGLLFTLRPADFLSITEFYHHHKPGEILFLTLFSH